jgi:hypothetical protein
MISPVMALVWGCTAPTMACLFYQALRLSHQNKRNSGTSTTSLQDFNSQSNQDHHRLDGNQNMTTTNLDCSVAKRNSMKSGQCAARTIGETASLPVTKDQESRSTATTIYFVEGLVLLMTLPWVVHGLIPSPWGERSYPVHALTALGALLGVVQCRLWEQGPPKGMNFPVLHNHHPSVQYHYHFHTRLAQSTGWTLQASAFLTHMYPVQGSFLILGTLFHLAAVCMSLIARLTPQVLWLPDENSSMNETDATNLDSSNDRSASPGAPPIKYAALGSTSDVLNASLIESAQRGLVVTCLIGIPVALQSVMACHTWITRAPVSLDHEHWGVWMSLYMSIVSTVQLAMIQNNMLPVYQSFPSCVSWDWIWDLLVPVSMVFGRLLLEPLWVHPMLSAMR